MGKITRMFQVFVKPAGPICNLECRYCYYLKSKSLYPKDESFRMPGIILEEYIVQHIDACTDPVIRFSWHGGEPTVLGLEYFRQITEFQKKQKPKKQEILNAMQTNGTLLNQEWCEFLEAENFYVGLSLDGPREFHDRYRLDRRGKSSFAETIKGYELMQRFGIHTDILCVVNDHNVRFPLQVFDFFKRINARYVSFLPLVERQTDTDSGVSQRTVPSEAFGDFLCSIFDEWVSQDIGKIKIQIFEEAARTAFGLDHSLCIFRETCGDIPVMEHNGDFYSCDHFVDSEHCLGNIIETPLVDLLESPLQRAFGRAKLDILPGQCLKCELREMCNGGCPKDRFLSTPDGEPGLNYLCAGYKRFFTHCQPFVAEVADRWREENPDNKILKL